jgi:hypothetical protein
VSERQKKIKIIFHAHVSINNKMHSHKIITLIFYSWINQIWMCTYIKKAHKSFRMWRVKGCFVFFALCILNNWFYYGITKFYLNLRPLASVMENHLLSNSSNWIIHMLLEIFLLFPCGFKDLVYNMNRCQRTALLSLKKL